MREEESDEGRRAMNQRRRRIYIKEHFIPQFITFKVKITKFGDAWKEGFVK